MRGRTRSAPLSVRGMSLRRPLRLDVDSWPRERFLALLIAILLACAWMVSVAARDHADIRRRYFVGLAKRNAASPIPYLGDVGALRRADEASLRPLRLVVRADSAAGEPAARLCRLAEAERAIRSEVDVTWVALGADVAPCVARAAGPRLVRPGGPASDTLRAQLRDARWVLVDARWRSLYSRRDAPEVEDVREVAALVAPGLAGAVAQRGGAPPVRGEGS